MKLDKCKRCKGGGYQLIRTEYGLEMSGKICADCNGTGLQDRRRNPAGDALASATEPARLVPGNRDR